MIQIRVSTAYRAAHSAANPLTAHYGIVHGQAVGLMLPQVIRFNAADPANLGWFSRCQFYVDGLSGAVLQTPIQLANTRDRSGRALPHAIRLQINKELPATFRLPNKAPVTEQLVYNVLFNFLNALMNTGVGISRRCAALMAVADCPW